MYKYQKFLIRDMDRFDPYQFPWLDDQLAIIKTAMASAAPDIDTEMILAHLNGQAIKAEWTAANPEPGAMIHNKGLPLGMLAKLYESARYNAAFLQGLQDYILRHLKDSEVAC